MSVCTCQTVADFSQAVIHNGLAETLLVTRHSRTKTLIPLNKWQKQTSLHFGMYASCCRTDLAQVPVERSGVELCENVDL